MLLHALLARALAFLARRVRALSETLERWSRRAGRRSSRESAAGVGEEDVLLDAAVARHLEQGAPRDWVERVRRGAPGLLLHPGQFHVRLDARREGSVSGAPEPALERLRPPAFREARENVPDLLRGKAPEEVPPSRERPPQASGKGRGVRRRPGASATPSAPPAREFPGPVGLQTPSAGGSVPGVSGTVEEVPSRGSRGRTTGTGPSREAARTPGRGRVRAGAMRLSAPPRKRREARRAEPAAGGSPGRAPQPAPPGPGPVAPTPKGPFELRSFAHRARPPVPAPQHLWKQRVRARGPVSASDVQSRATPAGDPRHPPLARGHGSSGKAAGHALKARGHARERIPPPPPHRVREVRGSTGGREHTAPPRFPEPSRWPALPPLPWEDLHDGNADQEDIEAQSHEQERLRRIDREQNGRTWNG